MLPITASQVTAAVRSLFSAGEPQARRCFAVLYGVPPAGKIFVDSLEHPKWGVVQEPADHSVYLGGSLDAPTLAGVFADLRRADDVLVGMWPKDPRIQCLPPNPDYDGRTLEFYDRPHGDGLEDIFRRLPAGLELKRLDRSLILRTEWGPDEVRLIGGVEAWEAYCLGYGLMQGDEILSAATVGPPALGLYEPGVFTRPDQRRKGYATIVSARLIWEIETLGGVTYWNCAKQNFASVGVARRLGYRIEKEYRCMAWNKSA